MNYEQDIKIDESSLDIELLEQASLFMKYSKNLAGEQLTRDKLSVELDLKKAELDKAIRTNPEKYGIEKITENAVSNTIITQKDYQDVQSRFMQAKYEADIALSAVRAFDMRKSMLENLVKLNGQQYFAGPKVPRDLSAEREEHQKNIDSNIAKRMQRKRV